MKHTPGPWEVKFEFNVMDCRGRNIAACGGFMTNVNSEDVHAEKIANARLVSAAPDMYEVLTSIENDTGQVPEWLWDKIQQALQKARGEGE